MDPSIQFHLEGSPFIPLNKLLKAQGLVASGAEAKQVVLAGLVRVDGELELRIRRKLKKGHIIQLGDNNIQIHE